MNSEELKENYAKLPIDELTQMVSEITSLPSYVVPILRSELIKREALDELQRMESNLVAKERMRVQQQQEAKKEEQESILNSLQVDKIVRTKMADGATLQDIITHLNEQGFALQDIIAHPVKAQELVLECIVGLRNQGLTESEITKTLCASLNLSLALVEEYNQQLVSKINRNRKQGTLLLITGAVCSLISITIEAYIGLSSIALIIGGIVRHLEANKQSKTNKVNQEKIIKQKRQRGL